METEYGLNILNDSVTFINANSSKQYYALTAILEAESSLKVIIGMEGTCNISGGNPCSVYWFVWDYFPIQTINWEATEYRIVGDNCSIPGGHVQVYTAKPGAECNLRIEFAPVQFTCTLKRRFMKTIPMNPQRPGT